MSGAQTIDLDTTEISCGVDGVNSTLSFVTYAGKVFGKNTVSLGVEGLNSVLRDPLLYRFNLTLVNMVPTWDRQGNTVSDSPPPEPLVLDATDYPVMQPFVEDFPPQAA